VFYCLLVIVVHSDCPAGHKSEFIQHDTSSVSPMNEYIQIIYRETEGLDYVYYFIEVWRCTSHLMQSSIRIFVMLIGVF